MDNAAMTTRGTLNMTKPALALLVLAAPAIGFASPANATTEHRVTHAHIVGGKPSPDGDFQIRVRLNNGRAATFSPCWATDSRRCWKYAPVGDSLSRGLHANFGGRVGWVRVPTDLPYDAH